MSKSESLVQIHAQTQDYTAPIHTITALALADDMAGAQYIENCGPFRLGFKNEELEKKYFDQFLSHFDFRNNVGCFLTAIFVIGHWIVSDYSVENTISKLIST